MALETLLSSPFFYVAVIFAAYFIFSKLTTPSTLPPDVPWIELPKGRFAKTRMRFASLTQGPRLLELMNEKYASKGLECIWPSFLGEGEVMLPPSQMDWLISQPEDVLNLEVNIAAKFQVDYTLLDPLIVREPLSITVIKRDLTRRVGTFIERMRAVVGERFDEVWGTDAENWRKVVVYGTQQQIIAKTSFSIFTLPSICKNREFIDHVVGFAMAVPLTGLFLNIFPDFIKPLAGRIATIPIWWHYYKSGKYVIPEIRRRLENHKRMKEDPEFKYEEPEDFITWHIRIAEQSPHAVNMTAEMIWKRIISVGFVSLHTTVFTATSALLDLAGAPPEHKVFEVIRAEVEQVLAEEGGKWTKAGLGKMIHLDSAIRESMRLSGIISRGPERTVVAKGGVVTPTGIHLPQGAHVGIASYGSRYDNNIYEHGREYDAFRFSRQRQSTDHFSTEAAREAVLKNKNLAMVTTGKNFVQFGHGQHSCPGRFFAAAQLKIMLSYIVLNYDIKHLNPRPPGEWVGDTMLPPRKATIEIRRRKQLA